MKPRAPLASLALAALSLACAHQKQSQQTTFHYRAVAHPIAPGDPFQASLDGQSSDKYADAVKYHLDDVGSLAIDAQAGQGNGKVAVLIYAAGKRPLARGRAGKVITTPFVFGDVFVVLRALPGTGPVQVKLTGEFTAAPKNAKPAPSTDVSPPEQLDPNELPLDGLLVN